MLELNVLYTYQGCVCNSPYQGCVSNSPPPLDPRESALESAGWGGGDNSPDDVAAPSSAAVTPVKAENAEADGPKPKADKPPAQTADADPIAALKKRRREA